jgi:ATP-dependent 26S proteasome regulatory subunit
MIVLALTLNHRRSGADLSSLIREAGIAALQSRLSGITRAAMESVSVDKLLITKEHFELAFSKVCASVTKQV